MRSRSRLLTLVATLLVGAGASLAGCVGDDTGTGDSATTSATTSASTGSTDTAPTSSTPSTSGDSSSTSGASASGSSTGDTTGDTTRDATTTDDTTGDATTTTADTTTTTTDSTTTTGSSTGGSGDVCDDLGAVDLGDCATLLGWAFDGDGCTLRSGCDCGDHCDAIFKDAASCAGTCAAAGECDEELLQGSGIAKGPYGLGDFCDEFAVCGDSSGSVADLMPAANCEAAAQYPCEAGPTCSIDTNGEVSEEQLEALCAASLLPDVELVACIVWGP